MRDSCPIHERQECMHNALRVDHHVQALERKIEKPVCLDQLEPLVQQGR